MPNKEKRGFAAMDEREQKEISKKGGESSHGGGRNAQQNQNRSEAGRKGGEQSHSSGRK